jgi:two-component sensor histidine kinase
MSSPSWAARPRPATVAGAPRIGRWAPAGLAELSAHRRQLAAALHDGARPPGADEDAVDRLLLAFQELTSNALRHGRGPVEVTVTATATRWLLEVSDGAADQPLVPAIGRDAAYGGLGLQLVAGLCGGHGWTIAGERKTVWALIDYSQTDD